MKSNKVFIEGYDAYCMGKKANKCPYKTESSDFKEWMKGWEKAKEVSNTPIFSKNI